MRTFRSRRQALVCSTLLVSIFLSFWFAAHGFAENQAGIIVDRSGQQFFNVGLTRGRGIESSVGAVPLPAVRLRAGYTFLASEILQSTAPKTVVFQPGKWLFRRPRHSGFFDVNWEHRRLGVDLAGLFVGTFVDSDFSALVPPIVENPGYTTWDTRVTYRVTAQISPLLSIDNLTDADYMEALGYRALRRAVRGGFRLSF